MAAEIFLEMVLKPDIYNGLTIDFNQLPNGREVNVEEFDEKLIVSLKRWTDAGRKCIWFVVPGKYSQYIPIMIKHGFEFHHAKPGYVMLVKWISNEPNRIPVFAHTTLGVGGLVYHSNNRQVLLIQEKIRVPNMWKFPGGYAEPREEVVETAIREVLEETGIECYVRSILSFRHMHSGIFGCSDFYFVCLMEPINNCPSIKTCQFEIKDCRWFDLPEAREQLKGFNKFVFEEFLKQYSLLEYEQANKNCDNNVNTGQTIGTKMIHSQYGPYKLEERVYSVCQSKLS